MSPEGSRGTAWRVRVATCSWGSSEPSRSSQRPRPAPAPRPGRRLVRKATTRVPAPAPDSPQPTRARAHRPGASAVTLQRGQWERQVAGDVAWPSRRIDLTSTKFHVLPSLTGRLLFKLCVSASGAGPTLLSRAPLGRPAPPHRGPYLRWHTVLLSHPANRPRSLPRTESGRAEASGTQDPLHPYQL